MQREEGVGVEEDSRHSSISGWLGRAGLKGKWTGMLPCRLGCFRGGFDGAKTTWVRLRQFSAQGVSWQKQCSDGFSVYTTLWTKCLTMDPRYVPDMRSDGSGLNMSSYVSSQYLTKCLKGCVGSHSSSSPAQEQAPVPVRWKGPGQDFPGPVSCECVGGWMVSVSLMCGEASCNLK
jgi:hypothetical protein